jgi:hypothetical protein
MNKQKQKRKSNQLVRRYRKMLAADPYFEKRFDIQEVQMSYIDGIIYKRYAFIFKHPNGAVIKKETKWYNIWEIVRFTRLFSDYNNFIMDDMKWNGFDKVSTISEELIAQYKEAYEQLSK